MNTLEQLRTTGQSLWLDHVSRQQIQDGSLMRCIEDWSITGMSLSSEAIGHALSFTETYDKVILKKIKEGLYAEQLAISLILEDVCHAADLLRHVHDRSDGVDGWVTIPASPLSTYDTGRLAESISDLHAQIHRPNILVTVSGYSENLDVIEETIFKGIPINIDFIYSADQYLRVAEAYLRGVNRRIKAALKPAVPAFISVPISRLEDELSKQMSKEAASISAISIARKIYRAMKTLHGSSQWERAYSAGIKPLKLVWGGTAFIQETDSDVHLYSKLIVPFAIALLPEQTIEKFINNTLASTTASIDGGDFKMKAESKEFDLATIADDLQANEVTKQVKTWIMLRENVGQRSAAALQTENVIITGEQR